MQTPHPIQILKLLTGLGNNMEAHDYITATIAFTALVVSVIAFKKRSKVFSMDTDSVKRARKNSKDIEDMKIDVETTKHILERYELKLKKK